MCEQLQKEKRKTLTLTQQQEQEYESDLQRQRRTNHSWRRSDPVQLHRQRLQELQTRNSMVLNTESFYAAPTFTTDLPTMQLDERSDLSKRQRRHAFRSLHRTDRGALAHLNQKYNTDNQESLDQKGRFYHDVRFGIENDLRNAQFESMNYKERKESGGKNTDACLLTRRDVLGTQRRENEALLTKGHAEGIKMAEAQRRAKKDVTNLLLNHRLDLLLSDQLPVTGLVDTGLNAMDAAPLLNEVEEKLSQTLSQRKLLLTNQQQLLNSLRTFTAENPGDQEMLEKLAQEEETLKVYQRDYDQLHEKKEAYGQMFLTIKNLTSSFSIKMEANRMLKAAFQRTRDQLELEYRDSKSLYIDMMHMELNEIEKQISEKTIGYDEDLKEALDERINAHIAADTPPDMAEQLKANWEHDLITMNMVADQIRATKFALKDASRAQQQKIRDTARDSLLKLITQRYGVDDLFT